MADFLIFSEKPEKFKLREIALSKIYERFAKLPPLDS